MPADKLTQAQKASLSSLEPALRDAADRGDYEAAKHLTGEIQRLLRPTGHENRLMRAKCWLFESALEAGHMEVARAGLLGVRAKTPPSTRVHLEATALLAIYHLRMLKIADAEPLIGEVLRSERVIRSAGQRRAFRRRMLVRFEEEALVAAAKRLPQDPLDIEVLHDEAGRLILNRTEDEIHTILGSALPLSLRDALGRIDEIARRQLPTADHNLLPAPKAVAEPRSLGKRIFESAKRVLWRSLCDEKSEVYRAWFTNGVSVVLDKKYIAATVAATLVGQGLAIKALAVSVVALVMKTGLEIYCETFRPPMLMDSSNKR